jgi:hypothetical protein
VALAALQADLAAAEHHVVVVAQDSHLEGAAARLCVRCWRDANSAYGSC